jgi:hypothetical protein
MRSTCAFVIAMSLAAATAGCETFGSRICDRSAEANPPVRYTGGTTENGVYMSSPWDGELLYFPGGMHYELVHGLGEKPRWIQQYLSFDRYGTQDGGTLAPAAGNQAVVVSADKETIVVANDSCVDYWLLVTAGSGAPQPGP